MNWRRSSLYFPTASLFAGDKNSFKINSSNGFLSESVSLLRFFNKQRPPRLWRIGTVALYWFLFSIDESNNRRRTSYGHTTLNLIDKKMSKLEIKVHKYASLTFINFLIMSLGTWISSSTEVIWLVTLVSSWSNGIFQNEVDPNIGTWISSSWALLGWVRTFKKSLEVTVRYTCYEKQSRETTKAFQ